MAGRVDRSASEEGVMNRKSSKVMSKGKLSARRGVKDLASRAAGRVKGGETKTTTTKDSTSGGKVTAGWDLTGNKKF